MVAEAVVAVPAADAEADERHLAGGDPRLQLVALGLRDLPGRDGSVDPVRERLLQRRVELGRVDPELLGRVRDDGVALRSGESRSAAIAAPPPTRAAAAAPMPAILILVLFISLLRSGVG